MNHDFKKNILFKTMEDLRILKPSKRSHIALFDFDGTLVKPKEGRPFPKDVEDWEFTRPSVPEVIHKLAKTHQFVIITDQSKGWKVDQIHVVMKVLNIDPSIIVGVRKEHQKPSTILFDSMFPTFDKDKTFYIGDAAGRKEDWSDRDKLFAEAIGVKFLVPEQLFPLEPIHFKPIPPMKELEVIIMVGYPASGKSTVAKSLGYYIVDGDKLRTTTTRLKDAEKHLDQSIVFDSTAASKKKRADYLAFAAKHKRPVRIVWVPTSMERSNEQNKQRALEGGSYVPLIAYYKFRKNFEEPTAEEAPVVKV
jgi:bifunctional polynucleotide phosphatase/kinase